MNLKLIWRFILWAVVSVTLAWAADSYGQSVHDVSRAIAKTEGFYIAHTLPNRLHNPGDLMTQDRHAYLGQVGTYHGYAVFKTDADGWSALDAQIQRIVDGTSTKYSTDPTFAQIARTYAADWRYWGRSVCKILQISPQATLRQYLGLAPRILLTRDLRHDKTLLRLLESRNSLPPVWGMPQMPTQVR